MKNYTVFISKHHIFSTFAIVLICLTIIQCNKEDQFYNKEKLGRSASYLPAPKFKTSDSIIVLKENETSYPLEIFTNDSLNYYYTIDGSIPDTNKLKYNPEKGIIINFGKYKIGIIAYSKSHISPITVRNFIISNIDPVAVSGVKNKTTYSNSVVIAISNVNASIQYSAKLNDSVVNISSPITVSEPNFYNLKIISKLGNDQRIDSFLFVIEDPAMFDTEWGLRTWVPKPFTINKITTETVETIYPKNFSIGLNLPVILKTTDLGIVKPLYFPTTNSLNSKSYNVKRGIGSMNLLVGNSVSSIELNCNGSNVSLPVTSENTSWTNLNGTINSRNLGKNARIHIDGNLTVQYGDTLQIEEGSIIAVDEAIDINNNGRIKIAGTLENPVVITCYKPDGFWGGFLSKGTGNSMDVSNAIICQSGYHTSAAYQWGHAKRQALFYLDGSVFNISNSYLIDHVGQIFYSTNATLQIDNILVQQAKTGGQLNTSTVAIDHSIFTDFPDDSYTFRDEDNDALYLDYCDATVKNSTFMFTKDDGIDSGGGEGGTVNIDNCWFEATFHEGLALSSNSPVVKHHNISNCTITNCEQGIELGYSSPNHVVNVNNCYIYKNSIGLRYGDNYEMSVEGSIHISNTRSVNNFDYDVWNMVRSNWFGKLNNMTFSNVTISKHSEQYPGLSSATTGIKHLSF